MHVVLVNWAKIWDGASVGGGVNGYSQALALSLLSRGHEVTSLCSGTTCTPRRAGIAEPGACEIRRHADWLGIRVFEVINSPVLAPSLHQFREPLGEVSSPVLEREMARWLGLLRPDVVHFQNLEGFSVGCVDAVREAGAKAVFSLHNYHTVCPQVYLMQGNRRPCHDFRAGNACVGCVDAPDPAMVRRQAMGLPAQDVHLGGSTPGPSILSRLRAKLLTPGSVPTPGSSPPPPGSAVSDEDSVRSKLGVTGMESRGQPARPIPGSVVPDQLAAERIPLTNEIRPEPPCALAPTPFFARREAMVAMLGRCDAVIAVSEFVRRKFEAFGIPAGRLHLLTVGTRMAAIAAARPELLAAPPPFDPAHPRAIRLVFVGFNNWAKGLPMFADALDTLGPRALARFHLAVYAFGGRTIEHRFRRLESRLAGLIFRHGYEYSDLPWLVGGQDAGIVPSVWWDNGPQTVLEFQACGVPVIGAEIGGIPDFVRDGVDGLLFRANDREALAGLLGRLAADPSVLTRLRTGIRPPKSMDAHAEELERLYSSRVS